MKAIITLAVTAGMLWSGAAMAETQALGTFGGWKAYAHDGTDGKVCFMSAAPEKQDSSVANIKRGDAHLFLTHWAGTGAKNVINIDAGYPLKNDSTPTLTVDGKTFDLTPQGEKAWSRHQDDTIAQAMRRGSRVVVKGTSARGTQTTDTYSLKGSEDAYKAITKACAQP